MENQSQTTNQPNADSHDTDWSQATREEVRALYAEAALKANGNSCGCGQSTPVSSCCCGGAEVDAAGQAADESVPSWGCGNPLAMAALEPGQIVLDLGSGAGHDVFLAARQVAPEGGAQGLVIGVDMTQEMLELARANARELGLEKVTDFRLGTIENLPLEDSAVDVVISNCVINLSTDKDAVFREAYRVLKPGGWLSVSDIVTHGELPLIIRRRVNSWSECISGALEEEDYLGKIRAAGFGNPEVLSREIRWSFGKVEILSLTFKAYKK